MSTGRAISSRNGNSTSRRIRPPSRNRQPGDGAVAIAVLSLLFPAAAKRCVQLDERRKDVPLRLCQLLLRCQTLTLGVEYFQVAADAANVAGIREPALLSQCLGER